MMIWTRLLNRGKGKNLWINYLMFAKCSNEQTGYIYLNVQFCELSCARSQGFVVLHDVYFDAK